MELLKTLKLTRYQRNNRNNPVLQRRIKLAAGITEQIQLAENPNYKSHSVRTVADDSVELTVRYGSRLVELVKVIDDALHKLSKGFSPIVPTKVC